MKRLPLLAAVIVMAGCGEHPLTQVGAPSIPTVSSQVTSLPTDSEALFTSEPPVCRAPLASTAHGRIDLEVQSNDDYVIRTQRAQLGDPNTFTAYDDIQWNRDQNRPGFYVARPRESGRYQMSIHCGDRWSLFSEPVTMMGSGGSPDTPRQPPSLPGGPSLIAGPVCTSHVFVAGGAGQDVSIAIPAGHYTLKVVTYDKFHKAGYQPDQISEQLSVAVNGHHLGDTPDIPEKETSATWDGAVSGPASVVRLTHALTSGNPNSVHGACVEVRK
jgi:hypothetical protein